jgi:hypothetical protein
MASPDNCPVVDQAQLTQAAASSLILAVKKLRRLQTRCPACAYAGACDVMQHWRASIDAAIAELATERSKTPSSSESVGGS